MKIPSRHGAVLIIGNADTVISLRTLVRQNQEATASRCGLFIPLIRVANAGKRGDDSKSAHLIRVQSPQDRAGDLVVS